MTDSAASDSLDAERTPNGGRSLEELLPKGLYYEFIAVPCGTRYTMPLGVYNGARQSFRVYRVPCDRPSSRVRGGGYKG
jgi:hypothetical protein